MNTVYKRATFNYGEDWH